MTAAVPVLADEAVPLPGAVSGGGKALANLSVLAGLAVLGTGPGRARPAGSLPLVAEPINRS